ncbi:MAG: hypothetical protein IPJ82_04875 [Lewinellaceae bacterium]|nr:hypothetical protein [Lewinellaceae bacterium]
MRKIFASLFLLLFVSISFVQARRLYVDAYATGANNGASWKMPLQTFIPHCLPLNPVIVYGWHSAPTICR